MQQMFAGIPHSTLRSWKQSQTPLQPPFFRFFINLIAKHLLLELHKNTFSLRDFCQSRDAIVPVKVTWYSATKAEVGNGGWFARSVCCWCRSKWLPQDLELGRRNPSEDKWSKGSMPSAIWRCGMKGGRRKSMRQWNESVNSLMAAGVHQDHNRSFAIYKTWTVFLNSLNFLELYILAVNSSWMERIWKYLQKS